jgi:nucleotide-binding universal stress UspA family protein
VTGRVEIVGYDGSHAARAAVRLAARRATAEGRVVVVHATPIGADLAGIDLGSGLAGAPPAQAITDTVEHLRAHAQHLLDGIPPDTYGDVPHETRVVESRAADAIADIASHEEADEIVIGSRGAGTLRWMLGSTSHALLQHAERPLVIVPTDAISRASGAGGEDPEIAIVGYDGSPGSIAALRYAGGRLPPGSTVIVTCVVADPPAPPGAAFALQAIEALTARAEQVLEQLDESLAGSARVEREIVVGTPAGALAQLARDRDATEIVVGSRGLGRFRAALGSVSHALLHEADRPVVVVPEPVA